MKSLCIHKDGTWWTFAYREGDEEALLTTMLERAQTSTASFTIEDVVAVVQACPSLFAKAA